MTSHQLAGFVSFKKEGAAFLIPFFRVGNAADCFAQEVGEAGGIERFRPLQIDQFHQEPRYPLGVSRAIGAPAFFAVRLSDGELITGGFADVRNALSEIDLEARGAPFFNVDAYAFIGELGKRDGAVLKAASLFENQAISEAWRKLEVHGRVAGLTRTRSRSAPPNLADKDGLIAWLRANLGHSDWVRRWSEAWDRTPDREDLREVAFNWVLEAAGSTAAAVVIAKLLRVPEVDPRVLAAAVDWVFAAEIQPLWPEIWRAVRRHVATDRQLTDRLNYRALEFLDFPQSNTGGRLSPAQWSSVWQELYRDKTMRSSLTPVALRVLSEFSEDGEFQKRVLVNLDKREELGPREQSALIEWMAGARIGGAWMNIFASFAPGELPDDVVAKALKFVESGNVRFSAWHRLWSSLYRIALVDESQVDPQLLQDAAVNWLHKASWKLLCWPDVLIDMLTYYPEEIIIQDVANAWLSVNSGHPKANAVFEASDRALDTIDEAGGD